MPPTNGLMDIARRKQNKSFHSELNVIRTVERYVQVRYQSDICWGLHVALLWYHIKLCWFVYLCALLFLIPACKIYIVKQMKKSKPCITL